MYDLQSNFGVSDHLWNFCITCSHSGGSMNTLFSVNSEKPAKFLQVVY